MKDQNQKNLLVSKKFSPIFWTQFFGAFNDNVFKNALIILIAYKSFSLMDLSSDLMVVLCGGIFILQFFWVFPFGYHVISPAFMPLCADAL